MVVLTRWGFWGVALAWWAGEGVEEELAEDDGGEGRRICGY